MGCLALVSKYFVTSKKGRVGVLFYLMLKSKFLEMVTRCELSIVAQMTLYLKGFRAIYIFI